MLFGLRGMLDIAQSAQRPSALHCTRDEVLKGHRVPGTALTVRCRNGAVLLPADLPFLFNFLRTM